MEKRYPRSIMATACAAWNDNNTFDEVSFRKQVKALTDGGIKSIYLFGTAGEGYAVSREQYKETVAAFLDQVNGVPGALPMVGVVSLSMSEVIERVETGMELGAQDFQISFPSWGAVTAEEGIAFLHGVCDRFPHARFMHYNNGLRSRLKLRFADYKRICEEIPNLAAVKNTASDMVELHELLAEELPLEFYVMEFAYGYASMFTDNCSVLISLLNLDLEQAWSYFNAGKRRDVAEIMRYHDEFMKIDEAISANIPTGRMDGAYDKLFVKANVPEFPLRLLPPYTGSSDAQYEAFLSVVKAKLPRWNIGAVIAGRGEFPPTNLVS